jgi:signal transduction histidine kinase
MSSPAEPLGDLTATARADRLVWLLRALMEVQSLITEQGFDLDTFMQRVVDLAQSLADASGAVVELVDGEEMVYRCASGSIREYVGLRLRSAGSLSGLCVAQARVLRCDDTEDDPRVDRAACRKVGARSMICTPLFRAGRAVGVLKVVGAVPAAFDSNVQDMLGLLGGFLGAALGNHLALEGLRTSGQREIERVKGEFVSVVSHELRTPLTSIRGSLGLVLGTMSTDIPKNAIRLLEIAHTNCERLIVLINDILDIDKIASGNMRFDMQRRSVAAMMRKLVQMSGSNGHRFEARLEVRPAQEDAWIVVDEDRFGQVLLNLLSNAGKFSPPGAVVTVDMRVVQGRARVSVTDQGPGIPDDFRARIFEKFSQADSSINRRTGGTGLGLHISRQIVERMNGEIGFDTQLGSGSTFWVEFPLAAESGDCEIAPTASRTVGRQAPAVLHVEQDAELVEVLSAGLHDRVQLVPAFTLRQAEVLLRQRDFAMIIADIQLPDAAGFEVLDLLESLAGKGTPILILCNDAPAPEIYSRVAAVMVKTRTTEEKIVATILQTIDRVNEAARDRARA